MPWVIRWEIPPINNCCLVSPVALLLTSAVVNWAGPITSGMNTLNTILTMYLLSYLSPYLPSGKLRRVDAQTEIDRQTRRKAIDSAELVLNNVICHSRNLYLVFIHDVLNCLISGFKISQLMSTICLQRKQNVNKCYCRINRKIYKRNEQARHGINDFQCQSICLTKFFCPSRGLMSDTG